LEDNRESRDLPRGLGALFSSDRGGSGSIGPGEAADPSEPVNETLAARRSTVGGRVEQLPGDQGGLPGREIGRVAGTSTACDPCPWGYRGWEHFLDQVRPPTAAQRIRL